MPHLVGILVDDQVADRHPGRLGGAPGPAQQRLDSQPQFLQTERFGEVVVPALAEAGPQIVDVVASGEKDDRDLDPVASNPPTHLEAVDLGHVHVENDYVGGRGFDPAQCKVTLNRWIAGEAARTKDAVTSDIAEHRYNDAAGALYSFIWHTFCDWYVELSKSVLNGEDETAKAETRAATAWALDQILLLLHPFMPFITEELWQQTAGETARETMLVQASWPDYQGLEAPDASEEIDWVVRLITQIRSVRSEMNVPAGTKVPCVLAHPGDLSKTRATAWLAEISRLARLDSLEFADDVPENSAQIVLDEAVVALPLAGVIDFGAEKARLEKELEKTAKDIASIDGRLNNAGFVAKAPPAVIEETRERREELDVKAGQVKEAIARLAAMG